ncbi:hypothetical protein QBC34DRAFT_380135 [Podospora aff. communis PSN243]|uniref:Oxidoreductase acuF-like C2H2 type zinc-finger domain-containing protein n=1 Tax=Podospora aff. communis PSN243 TaxID=3040156 RepID=A0AAV9GQE7_9PEZI|nr:hypothetical protein QBC34DRAFT_380135 [Podospora aff. communis PSN243]
MAILVRRQKPRGRLPSTITGFIPADSSLDITGVSDRFPRLRREAPWLTQRLGNAIAQRRDIIRYRQQHRRKLAEAAVDSADPIADAESTMATTYLEDPHSADAITLSRLLVDKRASICTFATSFMSSGSEDLDIGHRIPDLDRLVLDGLQLAYGEPFECPYCRTIQMAENLIEWR